MNRNKADLIIEAVHHKYNGQIDFVRAYQKRGETYSDCILVKRQELLEMLLVGRQVVTGQRIPFLGTIFSDLTSVGLLTINNKKTIATTGSTVHQKELVETPII
jgi:hypothetical protein